MLNRKTGELKSSRLKAWTVNYKFLSGDVYFTTHSSFFHTGTRLGLTDIPVVINVKHRALNKWYARVLRVLGRSQSFGAARDYVKIVKISIAAKLRE